MASIWRRTMVYLGLVDDDEYDEYEPYDDPQGQAQSQPAPLRRGARAMPEPVDNMYEPEPTGVRTLPREGIRYRLRSPAYRNQRVRCR